MAVVATPTFSPVAGNYATARTVTINDTDSGLAGFALTYTLDGTTPVPGSHGTVYTGPITISTTTTLKAVASATASTNSATATALFTITTPTQITITMIDGSSTVVLPLGNLLPSELLSELIAAGGTWDLPPDINPGATWWPLSDWKSVVTA